MAVSKSQQKAVAKYMKENYDEIKIRTGKGKREEFKTHASERGETLNGFINRAINETIQRDNEAAPESSKE